MDVIGPGGALQTADIAFRARLVAGRLIIGKVVGGTVNGAAVTGGSFTLVKTSSGTSIV
jgi:hypothetical protein